MMYPQPVQDIYHRLHWSVVPKGQNHIDFYDYLRIVYINQGNDD